jgi:membrane-associated phospholipid phosphatase
MSAIDRSIQSWVVDQTALISFSRVYVGVHYSFDVLTGAVLGVGIAIALRKLAAVLRRSEPLMRQG